MEQHKHQEPKFSEAFESFARSINQKRNGDSISRFSSVEFMRSKNGMDIESSSNLTGFTRAFASMTRDGTNEKNVININKENHYNPIVNTRKAMVKQQQKDRSNPRTENNTSRKYQPPEPEVLFTSHRSDEEQKMPYYDNLPAVLRETDREQDTPSKSAAKRDIEIADMEVSFSPKNMGLKIVDKLQLPHHELDESGAIYMISDKKNNNTTEESLSKPSMTKYKQSNFKRDVVPF